MPAARLPTVGEVVVSGSLARTIRTALAGDRLAVVEARSAELKADAPYGRAIILAHG